MFYIHHSSAGPVFLKNIISIINNTAIQKPTVTSNIFYLPAQRVQILQPQECQ